MVRALSPQSLPILSPPPIHDNFAVTYNPCSSRGAISVTDTPDNYSVHAHGETGLDIIPDDATAPTAPTASPTQTPTRYGEGLGQSRVLFNFENLVIKLLIYVQMITQPPTTSKACPICPGPRLRINNPSTSNPRAEGDAQKEHNIVPLPEACITKECRTIPGDNSCICKGANRRDSKQSKRFICLNWYASRTSLSVYYLSCEQQEDIHDPQKCQPTQESFQESASVFEMSQPFCAQGPTKRTREEMCWDSKTRPLKG
ncbi:hypothetical protein BU17DRAFT_89900 [Hysterangium stoloniferum]|nr:hypothetical protein BU17DRAFT_89900 [Hysterangium stoloniferum]